MDASGTLPQHEPVTLERSPLVLVVAQISFPAILSISTDDSLLAQFQDKIRSLYPVLLVGHEVGFSLGPDGVQQQQRPTRSFQFADSERQWTVALSANAISLETRNYGDIDEFVDRLMVVVAAARDTYQISDWTRVGLRYINELRYPGADTPAAWRSLINPHLLGPLSDDTIVSSVRTTFQELSLEIPDGALTMRHGFFSEGTTVAPAPGTSLPSETLGPFYLMDFDAFENKGGRLDEMFKSLFRSYNKSIYSIFRWGLTEKLFKHLKGSE
jgi:uncharacterized protein (TIGR04255 family)